MKDCFIALAMTTLFLFSNIAAAEDMPHGDLGDGTFRNPVLVGGEGDVTVIRVEKDYYVTFGRTLGVWHSRDLVNWKQVSTVDTRGLGSPWAPDIVYHEGRYFIYTTLVDRARAPGEQFMNVVFTADDPAGPWSDPIDLELNGYIDPGHLAAEDGQRYLYYNKGRYVTLDPTGTKITSGVTKVYDGWAYPPEWVVECFCLEAPKLLYRDGWYHMLSAQGGTAGPPTAHMVVSARSRTPVGPWENSPHNPLIRTASAGEKWHRQGHGQLIDDADGNWWMLYTGYNEDIGPRKITLLLPIEWDEEGWPVIPEGVHVDDVMAKPVAFQ